MHLVHCLKFEFSSEEDTTQDKMLLSGVLFFAETYINMIIYCSQAMQARVKGAT
jgi:hypothetical protein